MMQGIAQGFIRWWCIYSGPMATNVDRVVIDGVHISGTVIQAVSTFKVEPHGEEHVMTGKFDAPRDGGVLETLLGPLDEDVA